MKVLITGGAGFIGAAVGAKLARRGIQVIALDNLSPQIHGVDPDSSYTVRAVRANGALTIGDVRSRDDLAKALDGVSHVLHLAAETGTGQSMYTVAHYCDTNVVGTAVLLDLLVRGSGVRKVVVASSRAVYGEGKALCPTHGAVYPKARLASHMSAGEFEPKCPLCGSPTRAIATDEDSHLQPASVYAITKLTQEQLVLSCCASLGIGSVALRYQNVYGPGQSLINPYTGILSIFTVAMLDGRELNIFEDGIETRDFVFIEDVAEATVRALLGDEANGQVLNVGSGVASSVLDVVSALSNAFGLNPSYRISGDFRLGDIRHNFADTSRLESRLGFRASVPLEPGIAAFASWAKGELESGFTPGNAYEDSLREIRERGLLKTQEGAGQ